MSRGTPPAPLPDKLAPFEDALRARFPSREELLAEARAQTVRRRTTRKAGTAAAVITLACGLLWADPAWHVTELQTAIGEQRHETLPDGSAVVLNTGTTLRVEHRLRTRRLDLVAGEAAFQVAHGWRPFSVRSGKIAVHDIGTGFTVRRLADGADVGVFDGEVELAEPGHAPRRVVAGQVVRAVTSGPQQPMREVGVDAVGAWREGRLVFDGTPLSAVLAELARYRRAPLVLDDARAGALRLSGSYDVAGLEALIDALPQVLPVTVRRDGDGSVRVGLAGKKS